jgi:putative ABC transport system permease protein
VLNAVLLKPRANSIRAAAAGGRRDHGAARVIPLAWFVRAHAEPHSLIAGVEAQLHQVSGDLPVADVRSMGEVSVRSTSRQDFNMVLMTIFGATAMLLAAIGIYGLMACSVEQRRQEIGIRLGLGAGSHAIVVWFPAARATRVDAVRSLRAE